MRSVPASHFSYTADRLSNVGHVWAFTFDCVDCRPLFTLDHCSLARSLRIHLFSSTQRLSRTVPDSPSYLCVCLLLIHSGSQSLYFWASTIVIVSRGSFLPPQLLTHSASDDDTNNDDGDSSVFTYPIRFVFTSVLVSSPCLADFVFAPRFSKELQTNLSNRSISVISFCSALILFLLHMFLPRLFDLFVCARACVKMNVHNTGQILVRLFQPRTQFEHHLFSTVTSFHGTADRYRQLCYHPSFAA